MAHRVTLLAPLIASSFLLATPALADGASPAAPDDRPFASSAGVKLLVGGNLYDTPSNVPGGYDGLGFPGNGGGFGWGAALFYEARFVRHLGLELDLGYDSSTVLRNVTINQVVKIQEKFQTSGPRIGLLAKGIVPTPFGRLSLGLGPEFFLPSSAEGSFEITEGRQFVTNPDALGVSAKKQNSTFLAFVLGFVIDVGSSLEIPIDIKAARNLSQEADWTDRVRATSPTSYEVTAQSSWDFRLATGLAYRF